MATTTNYGWAEPDNTSLVKNGAQDIRILGDAIDASVWNIGYGQAGKNKIINGDFGINQRGLTSTTTNLAYGFDRFFISYGGGTYTNSAQTFTAGTAPVAGYEGKNFARLVTASQSAAADFAAYVQRIESVRTFAAQTVTVSMWAKASTGTPKIGVSISQDFGIGGGASSLVVTSAATQTITSSWVRYSFIIAVPSIAGKTIGTSGDNLTVTFWTSAGTTISGLGYPAVGIQNVTIDTWGWQIEYGSKATPFQTASGGSPQAELAMCQRYYVRFGSSTYGFTGLCPSGYLQSTTLAVAFVPLPVQMRVIPTSTDYSNLQVLDSSIASYTPSAAVISPWSSPTLGALDLTISGGTAARFATVRQSATTGYLGFSAEL
jgi:hypothetical protein